MERESARLLIVDDDERMRERLGRAIQARGLAVQTARDATVAMQIADAWEPHFAVVDLRMPGEGGLELLPRLLERLPELKAVVLTGYGSIATAVTSVRTGAIDYLTKPADADQVLAALGSNSGAPAMDAPDQGTVPSLERVEWEHIHRVLEDCGGNVSRAARTLGLHRRTLQRKLATLPPRR